MYRTDSQKFSTNYLLTEPNFKLYLLHDMARKLDQFLLLFFMLIPFGIQANDGTDFMRSTGKIYVVVAVIMAIFLGLIFYLIRIDRRTKKIEDQLKDSE